MSNRIKNSFGSLNKKIALINAFIWGLATWNGKLIKTYGNKKVPLYLNAILLIASLFLLLIMIYGSYRRQTD